MFRTRQDLKTKVLRTERHHVRTRPRGARAGLPEWHLARNARTLPPRRARRRIPKGRICCGSRLRKGEVFVYAALALARAESQAKLALQAAEVASAAAEAKLRRQFGQEHDALLLSSAAVQQRYYPESCFTDAHRNVPALLSEKDSKKKT